MNTVMRLIKDLSADIVKQNLKKVAPYFAIRQKNAKGNRQIFRIKKYNH